MSNNGLVTVVHRSIILIFSANILFRLSHPPQPRSGLKSYTVAQHHSIFILTLPALTPIVTQMMAASQMVMTMYSLETLNYLSLEVGGTLKVASQIPQCWETEVGLLLALVAAVVSLMLRVSQTHMT